MSSKNFYTFEQWCVCKILCVFHKYYVFFFSGVIGKITLQIPFYRPHSDPWVICMSQLNLIIGPVPPQEYDEVRERDAEREQKKQLLKALEDKWKVRDVTKCH